tara:strand:+ start:5173 stop:5700 length:528 start_codon:yes stop_codon:yes gene_type:complete
MHFLDYMIIAMLGYNGFAGLRQGAVRMINGILGIIIATSLSKTIFEMTFDQFSQFIPFFGSYPFLYFGLCFLILIVICQIIAQFIHTVFNWSGMGVANHVLGLILGGLRGLFIILIFVVPLMLTKPDFILQSSLIYQSAPVITIIIELLNESGLFDMLFQSLSSETLSIPKGVLE